MKVKTLTAMLPLPLLIAGLFAQSPQRPVPEENSATSLKRFVGTWKGLCADGKEFVVLTLTQAGNEIGGTISLGNFKGDEGQCARVVDPPTPAHAMKVSDAQLRGADLAFKGRGGTAFEMSIAGTGGARLKFLGSPVEDNPWELKKAN